MVALIAIALAVTSALAQTEQVRVRAIEAAIRLQPTTTSPIVEIVSHGTLLTVGSTTPEWYGVILQDGPGKTARCGFIAASVVEPVGPVRTREPHAPPTRTGDRPRVFVLDLFGNAIAAVEPQSGSVWRSAAVAGEFPHVIAAPGSNRLVVLTEGPRTRKGDPQDRGGVTVIDSESMATIARLPGVWGPPLTRLSPDDRLLAVMGRGYPSLKDGSSRQPLLMIVDLTGGRVATYAELSLGILDWSPGQVESAFSADARYLYVLDRGRASRKQARTRTGGSP